MNAAATDTATLKRMSEPIEDAGWISPIGQSISESIAEQERLRPEYKRLREEGKPYRELARASLIRRAELGISQRELARRLRISHSVIWRLERGERNFTAETMWRLRPLIRL